MKILSLILLLSAVGSHLFAEGPKPRKNTGVLVACEGCNTGKTVEVRIGRGEKIKVDADGTTSWGYISADVDIVEKMGYLAVFGQSVQADRLVVLDLRKGGKKIADLRYQELIESKVRGQKKWLLLEDSGYRYISPLAVWLVDLQNKTVATKMFDLLDPALGGVTVPLKALSESDGVGEMFWGPGHSGVLVTAQLGEQEHLYLSRFVAGKVVVKKLPWDGRGLMEGEPKWLDDEACEFQFKDGRRKRVDFRQGR